MPPNPHIENKGPVKRIIIVDDNDFIRDLLTEQFSQEIKRNNLFVETVTAGNFEEASRQLDLFLEEQGLAEDPSKKQKDLFVFSDLEFPKSSKDPKIDRFAGIDFLQEYLRTVENLGLSPNVFTMYTSIPEEIVRHEIQERRIQVSEEVFQLFRKAQPGDVENIPNLVKRILKQISQESSLGSPLGQY